MANNYRADVPTSTDFGLTGNWGSALAANQTLIFAYDVTATISTNLAYSGTDFAGITFQHDKRVPIGGSGSPLQVVVNQTSTGIFRDLGYGNKYISANGSTNVIYRLELCPSRPTTYGLSALKTYNLVLGGYATSTVGDDVVIDNTIGQVIITRGTHTIEYKSGDVPALVFVMGGTVRWRRDFGTMHIAAGATVEMELNSGVAAGGTVYMMGGTLVPMQGDLGKVYGFAGRLDKSKLVKGVTLDTLFTTENLTIVEASGGLDLTLTNGQVEYGRTATKIQP